MFGPPEDIPGACNARLFLGDDYGDNECTIVCQRTPGHTGRHKEVTREGTIIIEWDNDERPERQEWKELQ